MIEFIHVHITLLLIAEIVNNLRNEHPILLVNNKKKLLIENYEDSSTLTVLGGPVAHVLAGTKL